LSRLKLPPVAVLNLALAAMLAAVGFSGVVASFARLPSEVAIRAIRDGQPVDRDVDLAAIARLQSATTYSSVAREDLAMAMLADGEAPNSSADRIAADHAARQLQLYLGAAPDDSFAWANLASAELRRGTAGAALAPFKMSIELAPTVVASLVWRCGFGLDIYTLLDEDGRALLKRQFLMALDDSLDMSVVQALAQVVERKNGLSLASIMLADQPEARRKLERAVSELQ
jgi:tetratricopeptide (TPR) repeat protein